MNFYLSSYQLGNELAELKRLVPHGKIAYIPNALDFTNADPDRKKHHIEKDTTALEALGLNVCVIDLREYFEDHPSLAKTLSDIGAIFISGGNVFVLRQAIHLSGLDKLLLKQVGKKFLYAGYSAAGCVLAPSLTPYEIVDPPETPYKTQNEVIWTGLGLVDFALMPHWDSNHPESADIDKEIAFCEENSIPYKALRDGEVLIIEQVPI